MQSSRSGRHKTLRAIASFAAEEIQRQRGQLIEQGQKDGTIAKAGPPKKQLSSASANLARRNLTKGQQAMLLAMMYPEGQKGKKVVYEINNFSRARLSQARTVLRNSSKLATSGG